MKKYHLWLITIFLLAAIFHLLPIFYSDTAFNYDTAYGWLAARDVVVLKKPTLIGGEGGIKGIFFAPTWEYLLAIFFFTFKGDPRGGAVLSALINLSCIPLAWLIGKKINQKTGLLASLFMALSPVMIGSSSYSFVVNAFPFINLLAIYWLINQLKEPTSKTKSLIFNKKTLITLTFLASLSFHFEPVIAIGFNLALFYFAFKSIKQLHLKNKLLLILVWLLPFAPQLLFDLRHNWLQTRAIINFIKNKGVGLGGSLPFLTRLINRPHLLINHFSQTMVANNIWLAGLLFGLIVFGLKQIFKQKNQIQKTLAQYCLGLLIIPLLYYIFIFAPGIKAWYYNSFPALYGLLLALVLGIKYKRPSPLVKSLGIITIIIFGLNSILSSQYLTKLKTGFPSNDPSSLKNQLAVVDWVYQDAGSQPFVVYTYSPAIYDYPYQYLLWWHAWKNRIAFPKDFSYKPNSYDYVPNKLRYVPAPETNDQFTAYLIFEPHNPQQETSYTPEGFSQPFKNLSLITTREFNGRIRVEKRKLP